MKAMKMKRTLYLYEIPLGEYPLTIIKIHSLPFSAYIPITKIWDDIKLIS